MRAQLESPLKPILSQLTRRQHSQKTDIKVVHESQISKDAKAGLSPHKDPSTPSAARNGSGADDGARSPRSPRSPGLQPLTIPEVATLLEFVAWVVFCEVPPSARSANWFKGRGGFLADQLEAVREASIRIQARALQRDIQEVHL